MIICLYVNYNFLKVGLNFAHCSLELPCFDTANFECVFTAESNMCLCDPLTALEWNATSMDCTNCKSGYAKINQGCCKYKFKYKYF